MWWKPEFLQQTQNIPSVNIRPVFSTSVLHLLRNPQRSKKFFNPTDVGPVDLVIVEEYMSFYVPAGIVLRQHHATSCTHLVCRRNS